MQQVIGLIPKSMVAQGEGQKVVLLINFNSEPH